MPQSPQLPWQSITFLPDFADTINEVLMSIEAYLAKLKRTRPHYADDFVIEAFLANRADLWLYMEQLKYWRMGPLTPDQRKEIACVEGQIKRMRKAITKYLALANRAQVATIETQMEKPDSIDIKTSWVFTGFAKEGKKGDTLHLS